MKLTIEINGYQQGDLELALGEVLSKVQNGYTGGFDSNDTGNYKFNIDGEEVESWWIDCDREIGSVVEPENGAYPDTYSQLDEAIEAMTDDVPDEYKIYGLSYTNKVLVEVD